MDNIFKDVIDNLKENTGVFYIYNENQELVYIDFSKDIKNKLIKLFTSKKFIPKYVQNIFKKQANHFFHDIGNIIFI